MCEKIKNKIQWERDTWLQPRARQVSRSHPTLSDPWGACYEHSSPSCSLGLGTSRHGLLGFKLAVPLAEAKKNAFFLFLRGTTVSLAETKPCLSQK